MEVVVKNLDELRKAAELMVSKFGHRRVFLLTGEMGAGKTTLSQMMGKTLGVERMTSPTFVIVKNYELSRPKKIDGIEVERVHHSDLYRLVNKQEVEMIGLVEMFEDKNAITIVEWPEIIEDLWPEDAVRVNIKVGDENTRIIDVI